MREGLIKMFIITNFLRLQLISKSISIDEIFRLKLTQYTVLRAGYIFDLFDARKFKKLKHVFKIKNCIDSFKRFQTCIIQSISIIELLKRFTLTPHMVFRPDAFLM